MFIVVNGYFSFLMFSERIEIQIPFQSLNLNKYKYNFSNFFIYEFKKNKQNKNKRFRKKNIKINGQENIRSVVTIVFLLVLSEN